MKKFLLACGAAVMLSAAMTSCGNSVGSADDKTGLGDSLALAFGELQGNQFLQYYNNLPESEKAKINKDAILKGMKETLYSDTTNQGYLMGLNIGINFLSEITQIERMSDVRVDRKKLYEAFASAVKADSVGDMATLQAQMQSISMQIREQMQEFQRNKERNAPEAQEAVKKGKEFVEKAKKADNTIKTTESGLSYKIVAAGNGEKIKNGDKVKIKYTGKLTNGEQFDSSNDEAVEMNPNQVIPGFKEGLQLMDKGSKYVLYIPGDLAYDTKGVPGKIGPMETLVFEVELVDIVPADQVQLDAQPKAEQLKAAAAAAMKATKK